MVPLATGVFLISAFVGQGSQSLESRACGPNNELVSVQYDHSNRSPSTTEAGKVAIYFIQDDGAWGSHQHDLTRIGVDGIWVGGYKQNAYFRILLSPGEHHFCASVQSSSGQSMIELLHVNVNAGKDYYIRTRFLAGTSALYPSSPYVEMAPVDSDEAQYLIGSYPLSVMQSRK